jgi:predicted RNA-binding protein with RPS1 domain
MTHAAWTEIRATDAAAFVRNTLFAPSRTLPVVALTTSVSTGRPWIDAATLAAELGDHAQVVMLESGDATWALSAALPARLDVFGGAARIWWPGLTEKSDPFDHVLLMMRDPNQAAFARARILSAVLGGDSTAARWGSWRPTKDGMPVRPQESSSSPHRPASDLDGPDPWQRIADGYAAGDVVPGRVFRIEPRYVLVELLPGASVIVHLSELDYTWVRDPAELFAVGERVNVLLLELEPAVRRGVGSIKRALTASPRAGISLQPDDAPYLDAESAEESAAHLRRSLQREQSVALEQREELEAAVADRQQLAEECQDLKQQVANLRKELRSVLDRNADLEKRIARELDPLTSENAFLTAVRVEHARRCDEDDRIWHPLTRMRVGRQFLERLRELDGIEIEKVVEVCAQVASNRAREISGRAMHELTAGGGGHAVSRASDGAKAWRCALQVGTPSARRLHWWVVPHKQGETIEFASVATHDDFSIPN